MKKRNLLMMFAVMVAIFAFTTISAQADIDYSNYIVTDFDGLYDFEYSGSRYNRALYGQDFTVKTGFPDITISGYLLPDPDPSADLNLAMGSFWGPAWRGLWRCRRYRRRNPPAHGR